MRSFLLVLLIASVAAFVLGGRRRGPGGGPPPSCIAHNPGQSAGIGNVRVLMVGLDGADWRLVDPLVASGYLPTIGGILAQGARGSLDCVPASTLPCFCPPVWTSIATGVDSSKHKITEFYEPSSNRARPALWTATDSYGLTSTLVAYRGTIPPESSATYVATETGLDVASEQAYDVWPWPPPDPFLDDTPNHTKPADLFATLGLPILTGLPSWQLMGRDRVAMDALTALATDPGFGQTHLTMIILHSPDKSEHANWDTLQPTAEDPFDPTVALAEAALYTGPVHDPSPDGTGTNVSQLLEADEWLDQHLTTVSVPYDYVVLLSDHGMGRDPDPAASPPGAHHSNTPEALTGIFAAAGPGIVPGALAGANRTVLDAAPTLAYLLQMPVARNVDGCVMTEIFSNAHLAANPIYSVSSW